MMPSKAGIVQLTIAILVLGISIHTIGIAADAQGNDLNQMVITCNEQYDPGGWVAVPANASERGLFIGQMAVCVSKDSPRAVNCNHAWIFGCDPPEAPEGGHSQ